MKMWALGVLVVVGACGEKQPAAPVQRELEVWKSDKPPEPELTIEEQRAKLEAERENQAEPTLDPNDPREKHELVWKEGRSALKSVYEERFNVLRQLKEVKFDPKLEDYQKKVKVLLDKVESFGIGEKPEDLDTAAQRFCTLVAELRGGAEPLEKEGGEKLKAIDVELKALEEKATAEKKPLTRAYLKLQEDRTMWSALGLGAGYVYMALRNLYEEAYVLADFGARRSQITLRDCLGGPDVKPMSDELADKARLKVVKRAKYYVP